MLKTGRRRVFENHSPRLDRRGGRNELSCPYAVRARGDLLSTTHIEFKPGTDEVYAVAAGDTGGTWIDTFKGLAKGAPLYSQP